MSVKIDGVLKEWGERLNYGRVRGRKARNVGGGTSRPRTMPAPKQTPRGRLTETVRRSPEVMVKISGTGKNMGHIKAHMDYVARHGDVEVEDERGQTYLGKDELKELKDNWRQEGYRIRETGEGKREAFNLVLSMPPGTDRQAVKDAARQFAASVFDGHQYCFAAHEDEAHPHVHLTVKAVDMHGVRMNPRKADLQNWREIFADKMIEHGVRANATPRWLRGVTRRPQKQPLLHMEKENRPARVTEAQRQEALQEARTGQPRTNPAAASIRKTRSLVQQQYGVVAKALAKGDINDRALAVEIMKFVRDMPRPVTRHQDTVKEVKAKSLER